MGAEAALARLLSLCFSSCFHYICLFLLSYLHLFPSPSFLVPLVPSILYFLINFLLECSLFSLMASLSLSPHLFTFQINLSLNLFLMTLVYMKLCKGSMVFLSHVVSFQFRIVFSVSSSTYSSDTLFFPLTFWRQVLHGVET